MSDTNEKLWKVAPVGNSAPECAIKASTEAEALDAYRKRFPHVASVTVTVTLVEAKQ